MQQFPKLNLPNIFRLSKSKKWNPKLYAPMLYNESIINKSKILKPGTIEYDDFWDEMDYYCYNGYKPKGMPRITGKHFYYLNFNKVLGMPKGGKKKRPISPFYRDLDHWLFLEMEAAEKYGYGLIVGKPRRVGLSEMNVLDANYELTFFQHNLIGIAAGKDDKAQEFYDKLQFSLSHVHKAYRNGIITKNNDELKLGYQNRINKQTKDFGVQSLIRVKTMFADSSAFEGGSYSKVYFEEMGQFENSTLSFKATEPCFRDGHNQFGVPVVYGTGGEIDKGAKGFREMWYNNTAYNLKQIFIPAYYYYPGDGVPDEKTKKTISFFNHDTGVTDRELAKKYILEERKRASKSKETYIKHIQSYPITADEVFLKTKGGILDLARLNFQLKEINAGNSFEPVLRGNLIWKDTPKVTRLLQRAKTLKEKTKIRVFNEIEVKFEINENGSVWTQGKPINQNVTHLNYKPDIGACDSYDEENNENNEKLSSGCVMAYRCFSGPSREFNYPVGVLVERGDGTDDDVFYENAVKFAIYFDIEVLIEYTKYYLIKYFYDVGAAKYLRSKPNIEEANTGKHKNKDGIRMTSTIKSILRKLLKLEVRDNIHKCFISNIILDLIKFGDGNTDIAMTYGIALLHRLDIFEEITDGIEYGNENYENDNQHQDFNYYLDMDGNLRISSYGEQDNIEYFNPERDFSKREYDDYISKKNKRTDDILSRQKEYLKETEASGIEASILKMIIQEQRNKIN